MLTWNDSQKIIIIRIISFTAIAMSDEKRGAALALIHRLTFMGRDECNAIIDQVKVYVSDETLERMAEEQ